MASKEMAVRQTRKEARVLVLRKGGSKGIADIPWVGELTSQRTTIDSVPGKLYKDDYDNIEGTVTDIVYSGIQLQTFKILCQTKCINNFTVLDLILLF